MTCAAPLVRNADIFPPISTMFEYDDVMSVVCKPGFAFDDGATAHSLQCGEDGEWLSEVPSCFGLPSLQHEKMLKDSVYILLCISALDHCFADDTRYSVGEVVESAWCSTTDFLEYRAQCAPGGQWSVPPQTCEGV